MLPLDHPPGNWIAVASADHVARGLEWGIMQVCHGKAAPLKRIRPGDRVAYYSPTEGFQRTGARCQAFTALGTVANGPVYQVTMAEDFQPFRRDVIWQARGHAPILPLLAHLSFTRGKPSWGYAFRFGLFPATAADLDVIAANLSPIEIKDHEHV
ncbi:hypothetical protein VZ95_05845 [Elstera litoralis]|uniref:UPF0310 protein VZ95_05845 n=1 Tax=Elstera litoralis TaxID=552518 RepID=A0A0F3IUT8_9PROT|nr:EVE domain-containing protein [Elstera litoralis]KJV10308.1 hypothetical protein VZ95_05845 [Elstera litoralis]